MEEGAANDLERGLAFELRVREHGVARWRAPHIDAPHLLECGVGRNDAAFGVVQDAAERRLLEHHAGERAAPLVRCHTGPKCNRRAVRSGTAFFPVASNRFATYHAGRLLLPSLTE